MKLTIAYDLAKEFENLQRGLKTQHNPTHQPKLVREMMAANIDLTSQSEVEAFITHKIKGENIDTQKAVRDLQEKWDAISDEAIRRMNALFATQTPFEQVTVFLSLNGRCAYNFPERYFFVCLTSISLIGTILHELQHFYTHLLIQPMFVERGQNENFPAFKEALTVLLNSHFTEFLEEPDTGYEKHTELRQWIMSVWKEGMTVQELTGLYLNS